MTRQNDTVAMTTKYAIEKTAFERLAEQTSCGGKVEG